jgi:NADH:ubiquinone oxidoreductase subunit F (NADH-binding)
MQISKKIPFDDPNVLNAVRALYVVSNLIIAGIYFYVQQQINKKNGVCLIARAGQLKTSCTRPPRT